MNDYEVTFNLFNAMKYTHKEVDSITNVVDNVIDDKCEQCEFKDLMKICLVQWLYLDELKHDVQSKANQQVLEVSMELKTGVAQKEAKDEQQQNQIVEELNTLLAHLKYAYLGDNSSFSVIATTFFRKEKDDKLLVVLREHKKCNWMTIAKIKGISPSICMHKVLIKKNFKLIVDH